MSGQFLNCSRLISNNKRGISLYMRIALFLIMADRTMSIHAQRSFGFLSGTTKEQGGSKGWRSGESARLLPKWPGFKTRCRRHMWVELVVGSLLCSERFFSGYSGFPLSSKTNISKFQFDQGTGRRATTLWMCYP